MEEMEEKTVKAKAKKEKKPAEEGFELWNELEVQRIKFMVSGFLFIFLSQHTTVHGSKKHNLYLSCTVTYLISDE